MFTKSSLFRKPQFAIDLREGASFDTEKGLNALRQFAHAAKGKGTLEAREKNGTYVLFVSSKQAATDAGRRVDRSRSDKLSRQRAAPFLLQILFPSFDADAPAGEGGDQPPSSGLMTVAELRRRLDALTDHAGGAAAAAEPWQNPPDDRKLPEFGPDVKVPSPSAAPDNPRVGVAPLAAPAGRVSPDPAPGGRAPVPRLMSLDEFMLDGAQSTGGATGSVRAKLKSQPEGSFFQLKFSVFKGTGLGRLARRAKAGGKDSENLSELIGANVARAISSGFKRSARGQGGSDVGGTSPQLVPDVALVHDTTSDYGAVASRYLSGCRGTLDEVYYPRAAAREGSEETSGTSAGAPTAAAAHEQPARRKHVLVDLAPAPGTSASGAEGRAAAGGGVWHPSPAQTQDICRNLALSALVADHDVNPGNMVVLGEGAVGRIDFGHAFNDLITGPGGSLTGGGMRDPGGNRIRDFFNRDEISGISRSQRTPKFWRDYTGVIPSLAMARALAEVAKSGAGAEGLAVAKQQVLALATALRDKKPVPALERLGLLADSLAAISEKIGVPVTAKQPLSVINEVFANLQRFLEAGQEQMRQVADVCELQAHIEDWARNSKGISTEQFTASCAEFLRHTSLASSAGNLPWLRHSLQEPVFAGTLDEYIASRAAAHPQGDTGAVSWPAAA
ncbi:hypothetical protein WG922_04640 [Ramlibacter sp. AN1015]|uniref:hypothetical protein n=1 Tax=Ramlibacter sp. AN1015 TaxID=3133428 RepID=UPI0030C33485